jgi:hypothetical protein
LENSRAFSFKAKTAAASLEYRSRAESAAARKAAKHQSYGDCALVFAMLAEAQGVSKAALFEDMVAERLESLEQQGLKLGSG